MGRSSIKLRIIAGSLKGRTVETDDPGTGVRPTLGRHRESVLQILAPRLSGARTADLCAGSGVVGFEMLSRGAWSVDFVESDRRRAARIRAHADTFGVAQQCRVHHMPVETFLRTRAAPFDIVYYDPPYAVESLAALSGSIFPLVAVGGLLVYQRARDRAAAPPSGETGVVLRRTCVYGATVVEFYARPQ